MIHTIKLTVSHFKSYWADLNLKGHIIFIVANVLIIIGFIAIILSTWWTIENKIYFRQKIEENDRRINQLENK